MFILEEIFARRKGENIYDLIGTGTFLPSQTFLSLTAYESHRDKKLIVIV
jgi:hypothetical protein